MRPVHIALLAVLSACAPDSGEAGVRPDGAAQDGSMRPSPDAGSAPHDAAEVEGGMGARDAAVSSDPLVIFVSNLPGTGATADGARVALMGTLNGWSNESIVETVSGGALVFRFREAPELLPLDEHWRDAVEGANLAFRFVEEGAYRDVVRADFSSNDGNFRLALDGPPNEIHVDAHTPSGVDQDTEVWVDGVATREARPIDPSRYAFPGGRFKAVVMSFDDGNTQDRRLVGLFNEYGLRGTFHVNSGRFGEPGYLTREEIPGLFDGHEVSCHTVSHPYLSSLTIANAEREIVEDQTALAELVGYTPHGLAFPFGDFSRDVLARLPAMGIRYARIVASTGHFGLPENPLKWKPTCHHTEARSHADRLLSWDREEMALLYIWGHSWELDAETGDNSWHAMEELCQALGGHDDIWYATAAQVAEYLEAIRSLELGSDGSAHNPSSMPVWINTPSGAREIPAGHTRSG